eukprot:1144419-Pelagomonas_calceolata.AAC.5
MGYVSVETGANGCCNACHIKHASAHDGCCLPLLQDGELFVSLMSVKTSKTEHHPGFESRRAQVAEATERH